MIEELLYKPIDLSLNIKETTAKALGRINIKNIRDLLFYKPCSYSVYLLDPPLSSMKENSLVRINVTITQMPNMRFSKPPIKIHAANNSGHVTLVFFNKIAPFIYNQLKTGKKYTLYGKVHLFSANTEAQIIHPEFIFNNSDFGAIIPTYNLTYSLLNKQLYNYILSAIALLEKHLQQNIKLKNETEFWQQIILYVKKIHFTNNQITIEKAKEEHFFAKTKLAFLELLANQLMLQKIKTAREQNQGYNLNIKKDYSGNVLSQLGFTLTEDQERVIAEISKDQQAKTQMMRLLQGDVGSGKTVIALITILNVVTSGAQTALMAPTDLLAKQHYNYFLKACNGLGINIKILVGKTKAKERKIISTGLEDGSIDILIGTHALFQEKVCFKNLRYIVIDEQHRFGTMQRQELISKAHNPDVLIMTATPIPRSLSLTMFGDMDISILKQKPSNRLPIITNTVSLDKIHDITEALTRKINNGEKIYWICPLIDKEEGETNEQKFTNVNERFASLQQLFPHETAIIHGKMKEHDKEEIMQKFRQENISILVATTVIEVGIDVPQATLIVIENAENFGLAQLHQLRGRVGRGAKQSYCVLLYNPKNLTKASYARLQIMRKSTDGFFIAQEDLKIRGSGELLGKKQSGEPEFFFADLAIDNNLLDDAHSEINHYTKTDQAEKLIKLFAKIEAGAI